MRENAFIVSSVLTRTSDPSPLLHHPSVYSCCLATNDASRCDAMSDSSRLGSPRFSLFFDLVTIFFYRGRSSALRQTPNLDGQVPVIMSTSDIVAQLYPRALDSLSVAYYDSQGYDEVILTLIHSGTHASYLRLYGRCGHFKRRNLINR
jgi:hypothetical protein